MTALLRASALLLALAGAMATVPDGATPTLRLGEAMPAIAAPTLAGQTVMLPTHDGPSVILFGFSRKAGDDSKRWGEGIAKSDPAVPVYSVILLEAVPSLLRPLVTSSIRNSMPELARHRTVIVMEPERTWRARLGVGDVNRAYVLLLDRRGDVVWRNDGMYRADAAMALVAKARSLQ